MVTSVTADYNNYTTPRGLVWIFPFNNAAIDPVLVADIYFQIHRYKSYPSSD